MFIKIVLSYTAYALVTAFTPGPNNIVSLYAISQHGWKKGKNVMLGICIGFLCVMVICALFCFELAKFVPSVAGILKYIGAAYIFWLAIHIARSKPDDEGSGKITFLEGFLLEFVNVKIILYAITIYTGYVLPYDESLVKLLLHACVITCFGIAGSMTWACAGGIFQNFLKKYYKPFNYAMGAVLIYCAIGLVV